MSTFRRDTLALTGGRCAVCGTFDGVQAHHVRPVSEGGGSDPVGLPLCPAHHHAAHRA